MVPAPSASMADDRLPACPYCGSTRIVLNGYRETKTRGRQRRMICRACGRKFTAHNKRIKSSNLHQKVEDLQRRVKALEKRNDNST